MPRALISARVMRGLRALSERAMPDSATFSRPGAPASNGRGGTTPGTPTTATTPCRVVEGTGDEDDADALRRAGATRRLFVPVTFTVDETHTVTSHTLDGVAVAEVWDVVWAPAPNGYSADRCVGIRKG
jgi:hypothetical protein